MAFVVVVVVVIVFWLGWDGRVCECISISDEGYGSKED